MMKTKPSNRRAFTLVELLVVVAIIALLIGVLLPALSSARESGYSISCSNMQRQLAMGASSYAGSADGFYPGINSSGVGISGAFGNASNQIATNSKGSLPVQRWDWMTCSIDEGLPDERAKRFRQLMTKFACPSCRETGGVYPNSSDGYSNLVQLDIKKNGLFPISSYLMPANFQWRGALEAGATTAKSDGTVTDTNGKLLGFYYPTSFKEVTPVSFIPRTDGVKSPSSKVFCADGARYLDGPPVSAWDFDATLEGGTFGAFTDSGPMFKSSVAYGLPNESTASNNGNAAASSYRHKGKINAAFFDGHIDTLTDDVSRNPKYWYPSGYKFTGTDCSQKSFNYLKAGDKIP